MTEQSAQTATTADANTDGTALRQLQPTYVEGRNGYGERTQHATVLLDKGNDFSLVIEACAEISGKLTDKDVTVQPKIVTTNNGSGGKNYTLVISLYRPDKYVDDKFTAELIGIVRPKYTARAEGNAEIRFDATTKEPTGLVVRLTVTEGTINTTRNVVNTVDGVHRARVTKEDFGARQVIKFTIKPNDVNAALRSDTVQDLVDRVTANVANKLGIYVTRPVPVSGIDDDALLFVED